MRVGYVRDELAFLLSAIKPLIARLGKFEAMLAAGPDLRHSGRQGAHSRPAGGRRRHHGSYAPSWEVQRTACFDAITCVTEAYGPRALLPRPALQPAGAPSSAQVAALLATAPPAFEEPDAALPKPAPLAEEEDIFEDAKEDLHDDADPLHEKRLAAIKAGAKMRPAGWLHPAAFHAHQKRAKKEAQRAKKAQVAALPAEETAEVAALLAEAVSDPGFEGETALCDDPGVQGAVNGFDPRSIFERAATIGAARSLEVPATAATLLPLEVLKLQLEGDGLMERGIYDEAYRRYGLALDAYYAADPGGYEGAWQGHDLRHLRELLRKRLVAMEWCEHRGDWYLKRDRHIDAAWCYQISLDAFVTQRRPRPPALVSKLEEVARLAEAEAEYNFEADHDFEEALPDARGDSDEDVCPSSCPGFDKDWRGHAEAWCPKYLAAAGF
jgi:hypothetical protein